MAGGYVGKVLRVDLTKKMITEQTFSEETLRKYIGGTGLGTKILFEETTKDTDPLGPENPLIIMVGPLTGTNIPNFGRHHVVTKSPLTGGYGESNAGGTWGAKLKHAGYDGIIFTGKASKPVYLWIDNGQVEIRDAAYLWGKDTYEVDDILKDEFGKKIVTMSIGQAGEKLVKFASIMNDGYEGRAAGRCGVGAVMGSKNLKAVVVNGSVRPSIAKEDELKESIKKWAPKIKDNTEEFLGNYGTSVGVPTSEALGDLPIKNWAQGRFIDGAQKISGKTMAETILTKRYSCAQCVIACGRTVHVKEGPYAGPESGGPEYETIGMLGSNCLVDNLEAVQKANELCNRFGIDTISTGATIAFAMECYEKGLITKDQTGGLEIKWGDPDVLVEMVKKIALREDFAYTLGEGTRNAAEIIGGIAPELTVQVRGLDFPAHDPRAGNSIGLQYAVSARGACHLSSFTHDFEYGATMPELGYPDKADRFEVKGKGIFASKFQDLMAMMDSLTGCKFIVFGLGENSIKIMADWLGLVTGWDMKDDEFLETGDRIVTLKRMYNVLKCNQSRKDDILPPRMMTHRRKEGGAADNLPHLGYMLSEYYEHRGWDEQGIPTDKTLERLGLSDLKE
jgi:aldehyde:ferredoxin oxidoreductase